MKSARVLLTLLALLPMLAFAGYNTNVVKTKDWASNARRIAIAPAACPTNFDCAWLNEKISGYVTEGYPFVVGPNDVSLALLEIGAESLSGDAIAMVAQKLNVDSFLIPVVGNAETKKDSAIAVPTYGGGFIVAQDEHAQGSIEIRVIASNGKLLARGNGFGESGIRRSKGVVAKVFGQLVDELLAD